MAVAFLVIVGSLLLVVSGFTWVARRDVLDRARDIEGLTLLSLDQVKEPRLTAVRGSAVAAEPLVDPVTDRPAAYYEARLVRTAPSEKVLKVLRGGDVVTLEVGARQAEVRVTGAELDLPWEEREVSEHEPTPLLRRLLEESGVPVPAADRAARYAILHRAIRPGDVLTIVGTPRFGARAAAGAGYRGGPAPTPRFEADGATLLVTTQDLSAVKERERADVRAMGLMLRLAALLGAILVAVGAVLVALS
ncbi:MAG TPA: hypothetical protein VIL20_25365 [Sandaracinaceae bacterium]